MDDESDERVESDDDDEVGRAPRGAAAHGVRARRVSRAPSRLANAARRSTADHPRGARGRARAILRGMRVRANLLRGRRGRPRAAAASSVKCGASRERALAALAIADVGARDAPVARLMAAAARGHLEIVRFLRDATPTSQRPRAGATALMFAAAHGHAPVAAYLVDAAGATSGRATRAT